MAVVGKHSTILNDTGRTARVNAFSPDCNTLENIKIVDVALKWYEPYTNDLYILQINNALYIPSMENNLIPPFIMREAGIMVNDTPKIHIENPGVDNHSIWFPDRKIRIPLSLNGIFSYFPTSKPTNEDIEQCDPSNILHLSPEGRWNPYDSTYATNENNMVDYERNMIEEKDIIFGIANLKTALK